MVKKSTFTEVVLTDDILRKPLPLTTVDLQTAGSKLLRISPKKVLDVCAPYSMIHLANSTQRLVDCRAAISARVLVIPSNGNQSVRSSVRLHDSYWEANSRSSLGRIRYRVCELSAFIHALL